MWGGVSDCPVTSMLRFAKRATVSLRRRDRGERDRLYKPKFGPYENYGRKLFDTKKLFLKE